MARKPLLLLKFYLKYDADIQFSTRKVKWPKKLGFGNFFLEEIGQERKIPYPSCLGVKEAYHQSFKFALCWFFLFD